MEGQGELEREGWKGRGICGGMDGLGEGRRDGDRCLIAGLGEWMAGKGGRGVGRGESDGGAWPAKVKWVKCWHDARVNAGECGKKRKKTASRLEKQRRQAMDG